MVELVNARGQPLVKQTIDVNAVADAAFPPQVLFQRGAAGLLDGAIPNPRRTDWMLYYDMYARHPTVHAAIKKKVSVATNTGFGFVPREVRVEAPADQVNTANAFFDNFSFISELRKIYYDLEIFGDAYLYVVPDRRRRPTRLKRLPPWTMNISAKSNGDVSYYVQEVGNETRRYKPHEIIHFRYPDPKDDLYGLSRLEAIKSVVLADLLAEKFNTNFFMNGAATGTLITVEGATEKELEMNRLWIRDEYVGTQNAHKPIILAGKVNVQRATASHTEMGFLDGRRELRKYMLAVLDVPPAKIGDMESANRSNSKEQDKSFRTEAVMPLQYIVEEGISNDFLRDILGCPDILFKHSEGDIRDAQEQMDLWVAGARMGFLKVNEVRAMMGKPNIEGGDVAYVMTPTGAVPVPDLELYFKLPRMNTDQIPEGAHIDPADGTPGPSTVGPKPKRTKQPPASQLAPPTSKALATPPGMALQAALSLAPSALADETALRHCYAYTCDAFEELQHPDIGLAQTALSKALHTDDDILRQTYIERAQGHLYRVIEQKTETVRKDDDDE